MTTTPVPVLAQIIAQHAAQQPDLRILTIDTGTGHGPEVRTCRELWDNGRRLAAALVERGMRPGEHFALLMANHVEFVEAMIAACLTATVFVPIDPRTRGDKLVFMLDFAECRGVIAADYALHELQQVRPGLRHCRWVIGLASGESAAPVASFADVADYAQLMGGQVPSLDRALPEPEAPMQLLFTSGTTGDPKGIVLTHRRWVETAALVPRLVGWQADERPYSGLSLTHANAQVLTLAACLVAGMPCVLSRRFTKSRLWDITRRYGCTTFNLLGGMTTAVYSEPRKADDAHNPVRLVLSAGMPAAIWEDFEMRFGLRLLEFYGAAEGGMTFKPVGVGPIGSIGRTVPNLQHRIVDEQGNDVPRGQPGELLFRNADGTPYVVEYYRNPDASAKKCAGGWLHMGDIVREDEQGWLYFMHRAGGGIRRNGDFVNPGFVEKAIADFEDVDDVFVYGVPSRSGAPGEKDVVAAVVPRDPARFDVQALVSHTAARVDSNAVPSYIQVVDAIPKTASEKPQERFLVELMQSNPEAVHATGR